MITDTHDIKWLYKLLIVNMVSLTDHLYKTKTKTKQNKAKQKEKKNGILNRGVPG